MINPFWTCILVCADQSYYTGLTDNLEARLLQHLQGVFPGCYTFRRRPVTLAWSQEFAMREEAISAEQQIKGWSRAKKRAPIKGDWLEVRKLAQRCNG